MRTRLIPFLATFIFTFTLVFSPSVHAVTFNVTPTSGGNCAADPNDCTLQEALDEAAMNGDGDTINLAAGTYCTSPDPACASDNGGNPFTYNAQAAPPENFPLTIVGAGKDATFINGGGDTMNPGDQCMFLSTTSLANDFNSTLELRDFTFENCAPPLFSQTNFADNLIDALGLNENFGGLVVNALQSGNVEVTNTMSTAFLGGNTYGLNAINGNINFSGNSQTDQGDISTPLAGAMISSNTGDITFENNSFSNLNYNEVFPSFNTSFGNVSFNGNTYSNVRFGSFGNITSTSGGVLDFNGNQFDQVTGAAGLTLSSAFGEVNFTMNTFTNFSIDTMAVFILSTGSTVDFYENSFVDGAGQSSVFAILSTMAPLNFSKNIFNNVNASTSLLTLNHSSGEMSINGNALIGNSVATALTQINCSGPQLTMNNNIVAQNVGGTGLSPLYIALNNCNLNFTNNDVYQNSVQFGNGGGVSILAGTEFDQVNLYNNILFGNQITQDPGIFGADIYVDNNVLGTGSPVVLANNDVGDFASQCELDAPGCSPTNVMRDANINSDPMFRDPGNLDFSLLPGSQAIAAGDANAPGLPTEDFNGNPLNNPPDMGAVASVSSLSFSPATINFGEVSTEVPAGQLVTFTNNGGLAVTVTDMTLDDTTNYSLDFNPMDGLPACGAPPFTLDGGASCIIQVTFAPTGAGSFAATLTITTDEAGNPSFTIAVAGIGVATGGGCALGAGTQATALPVTFMMLCLFALWSVLRRRGRVSQGMKTAALAVAALTLFLVPEARAATVTVSTAADFQTALTNAEGSGEPDTIILEPGVYCTSAAAGCDSDNGGSSFNFSSAQDFPLTIQGAGKDQTILDGINSDSVLNISVNGGANNTLLIQDLAIQRGSNAINIVNDMGDTTVENCAFNENLGGVNFSSNSGSLNYQNNMVTNEKSFLMNFGTSNDGAISITGNMIQGFDPMFTFIAGFSGGTDAGPVILSGNQFSDLSMAFILSGGSSSGALNFEGNSLSNINFSTGMSFSAAGNAPVVIQGNTLSSLSGNVTLFSIMNNTGPFTFSGNSLLVSQVMSSALILTSGGPFVMNGNAFLGITVNSVLSTIGCLGSSLVMTNNIAAMNVSGASSPFSINAIQCPVTLTNNTFYGNRGLSTNGGAVSIFLGDLMSRADVFNNIFFANLTSGFGTLGKDIYISDKVGGTGAPVAFSNNDVGDFVSQCQIDEAQFMSCTPAVTEPNNLNVDPDFVNAGNFDFNLSPGSPVIGQGDPAAPSLPATDFNGNPLNNPPDLGALAAFSMLVLDPAAINFGQVSTEVPATRLLTLTNSGAAPLNVTGMSLDDTTNFSLNVNAADGVPACGSETPTINPGESCVVGVIFSPTAAGVITAVLSITTDELGNPTLTVSLSGEGVQTGGGCSLGMGGNPHMAWILVMIPALGLLLRRWRAARE